MSYFDRESFDEDEYEEERQKTRYEEEEQEYYDNVLSSQLTYINRR